MENIHLTSSIIETFEKLIDIFLISEIEIQNIIYPQFIKISNQSKKSNEEQLPKLIQTLLFKTLFKTLDSEKEATVFPLIKGWLDILIYNQTPRDD
jgi:hypothetical protein